MNRSVLEAGAATSWRSPIHPLRLGPKGQPAVLELGCPGDLRSPCAGFIARLRLNSGKPVPTGVFGADMAVSLVNDGAGDPSPSIPAVRNKECPPKGFRQNPVSFVRFIRCLKNPSLRPTFCHPAASPPPDQLG